jgi:hypothetical protein
MKQFLISWSITMTIAVIGLSFWLSHHEKVRDEQNVKLLEQEKKVENLRQAVIQQNAIMIENTEDLLKTTLWARQFSEKVKVLEEKMEAQKQQKIFQPMEDH